MKAGGRTPRRATGLRALLVLTALGLLALLVPGCGLTEGIGSGGTAGAAQSAAEASSRKSSPELGGTTLDGLELSKEAFAGKPLVLAFWGST